MAVTRLGIIGIGGFGLFCLDKCRFIPDVQVTAIAEINLTQMTELSRNFGIPFTTTDWRELIAHPEVDVVHIATPPSLHAEQAIAAAQAGKHIFCEKPLAISIKEADAIFAAADENDVRVGIDFVMRYSDLYDKVKIVTQEGLLGKPQRFLFENNAKDLPAGHWFWDPWLSGRIPVEHGVHFFDIFEDLFGPGVIQYAGRTTRPGGEEDKWLIVLQYGDQMYGSFYHGFYKPWMAERTWAEIDFERGRIRLDEWIPINLTLDGVVNTAEAERLAELFPGAEIAGLYVEKPQVLVNGTEMTVTHRIHAVANAGDKEDVYGKAIQDAMGDFVAWTRDSSHQPRVTGENGRHALKVALDAIARAEEAAGG